MGCRATSSCKLISDCCMDCLIILSCFPSLPFSSSPLKNAAMATLRLYLYIKSWPHEARLIAWHYIVAYNKSPYLVVRALLWLAHLPMALSFDTSSNDTLFLSLLFLTFLSLLLIRLRNNTSPSTALRLPPGPPAWPLVGNFPLLLAAKTLPHRKFAHLAQHYGPIFLLRLGSTPTVVISSPALAKQFLHGAHDQMFANRPHKGVGSHLFYPDAPILMQYGTRYTNLRKFLMRELSKIQAMKQIRMEEISQALMEIQNYSGGGQLTVNLSKILCQLQANMITRVVLSQKVTGKEIGDNQLQTIIKEMIDITGRQLIGDYVPYLGWLDLPIKRRARHLHDLIDTLLSNIIAERRLNRVSPGSSNDVIAPKDFLDSIMEINEYSDEQIKAATLTVIAASIDTSSVTVDWAMAELLRNPAVFQKLQDEIRSTITDKQNLATESDVGKLTYLHAVINETFRLHPIVPTLFPHVTNQACQIGGYYLPEKTHAIFNVWAIGHSSSVWDNPEDFKPERFMESNIHPQGHHFELIPFGAGRRMCLGMRLGLTMVELMLTNLILTFDWQLPPPLTPKDVDMTEQGDLVIRRLHPLILSPKLVMPRVPTY